MGEKDLCWERGDFSRGVDLYWREEEFMFWGGMQISALIFFEGGVLLTRCSYILEGGGTFFA